MVEFGERIYNLRKKSGLSQEEFADKLGVSRQAVSKWETGQSVPDSEKAAAIGTFFGVSLDWLINGEERSAVAEAPAADGQSVAASVTAEESLSENTVGENSVAENVSPAKKKTAGIGKALLCALIITLSFVGAGCIVTFIYMLAVMGSQNMLEPSTFYMLVIIVPGYAVMYVIIFIISLVVIRKRRK